MGVPRKRVLPPVRVLPVVASGHLVVLVDRHVCISLYASVCVCAGRFVRPFRTRVAETSSSPVDSASVRNRNGLTAVLSGTGSWVKRRRGLAGHIRVS
ncbi:hypothetical protein MSHI_05960 [Mycobacterium shinjukuense]|uniref:Uncharacterized protein n=1 Tax=Mycobacterium shinjukuense TaxID=398694 RepID=A0A7I7MLF1_9MYCO|nr:hypothetical protein MSHI_05960 [Mycobacterium shinjukuense]